ncbi:23 kDa integral membrane protein-like isoform X1 [Cydia splendana]|uniref:23 kDa integral membrane protein-like isoform X1 n=1 Tax=Cydia splendana TaxID=1100963 RepID=UPI00213188FA
MVYQMSEFGHGCSRILLVALNVLCIVTALFIFGFAVVDTRILDQYGEEEAAGTYVGDLLIIAACTLLVIMGIFGIVAVLRNSVKLLYLYVGFHVILMLMEVMLAIYVALQRYGLEYKVTSYLREDFFRNVTGEDVATHRQYWEFLEANYECCGLNGPDDYQIVNSPVSVSCCPRAYRSRTAAAQKQLYRNCLNTKAFYTEGCEDAILYALRDSADCMIGVASMCFWFEVTGTVLSLMVAHNLKNRVQVYKKTVKY